MPRTVPGLRRFWGGRVAENAECALLGRAADMTCAAERIVQMDPDDFTGPRRHIAAVIAEHFPDPVDEITIADEAARLAGINPDDMVRIVVNIFLLKNAVPASPASVRRWAELIERHARRRRMITLIDVFEAAVCRDDEEAWKAALADINRESGR